MKNQYVWCVTLRVKYEGVQHIDLYSSDYTLDELKLLLQTNQHKTRPDINFVWDDDNYTDVELPYYLNIEKMKVVLK